MNDDPKLPGWLMWLLERGFVISALVFLVGMIGLIAFGYYFNSRLGDIESQLGEARPASYQAPDLAAYAPGAIKPDELTTRQAVYVPIYSHVYYDGGRPFLLESTLSIRNTDRTRPIYVQGVRYYDTSGKLARAYVEQLIKLEPLQTIEFLVKQRDTTGGSGANFIVEWGAPGTVDTPVIEAVMMGVDGAHSIAFARSGSVLNAGAPNRPD